MVTIWQPGWVDDEQWRAQYSKMFSPWVDRTHIVPKSCVTFYVCTWVLIIHKWIYAHRIPITATTAHYNNVVSCGQICTTSLSSRQLNIESFYFKKSENKKKTDTFDLVFLYYVVCHLIFIGFYFFFHLILLFHLSLIFSICCFRDFYHHLFVSVFGQKSCGTKRIWRWLILWN